jgi:hypothetical protein
MKTTSFTFIAIAILIFTGCTGKYKTEPVTLPNGKVILVNKISSLVVGDGTKILMLTYLTNISINNIDSLQYEVDQIWPWYRDLVDSAKYEAAGISAANIVKEGLLKWETRNYTFIYEKKFGVWKQCDRRVNN